jgi:arsenite methyltransferase
MDVVKETQHYYGDVLKKSSDLKTNACCTMESIPNHVKDKLKNIHDDVLSTYYGCGLVMPDCLENTKILDLGCGSGRDVYLLSQFVGENGKVIGVDMTDNQLEIAQNKLEYHMEKFGYSNSNVEFKKGNIEELDTLGIENDLDIVVSNCVVNLCKDKEKVLKNVFNLLKTGGEFYFSDVYSSQRIPSELAQDPVLWGECLSGALYWNDFLNIAKKCGFTDPRLVKSNLITVKNKELEEKVGDIKFYSATYRLFKLPGILESDCEDYGQAVIYKGTIPEHRASWNLDNHHKIITGKIFTVCGNTWNMLNCTRFKDHFEFIGDFNTHYGIFAGCGTGIPFEDGGSCC